MSCTIDGFVMSQCICRVILTDLLCLSVYVMYFWQVYYVAVCWSCTIDSLTIYQCVCHVLLTVLQCLSVYVMYYWQSYNVSVYMSCTIDRLTMSQSVCHMLCLSVYVMYYWQCSYISVCHVLLSINVKLCNQLSVCNNWYNGVRVWVSV